MSAIPQFRSPESEAISNADPEMRIATPIPAGHNPLQLLREAITGLNSAQAVLPDPTQVANLLAEAQQALTHARVIAGAGAQCAEFLREAQFDKAFETLDAALLTYPADPALVSRRRQIEEQQRAFHAAAAVRAAIEETQWLLDQARPDLALRFLKEKAAELPDQPALISRLQELEAEVPQWEQSRQVEAALIRAATLEQLQYWQGALTVLEEALRSYPASAELMGAGQRVRSRLAEHERQKKLARRLELIRQQIAAQSWKQALSLLEDTQKEFPGASELNALATEVDTGLKHSECEAAVTQVRRLLADGEWEQAEQILGNALESLGLEPALEALRRDLEADRIYREELRAAQVLFGRRQLMEAERVLVPLVSPGRPEAQALLDAVREARASAEEENFCERGREKALKLIEQHQFAQAADLLRNLLALFPGDPILQRDLLAAESGLDRERAPAAAPAAEGEHPEPPIPVRPLEPAREQGRSRIRRAAIVGTASLALVSASGAAWKLSRRGPQASPTAAALPPPARPVPGRQEFASLSAPPAPETPEPSSSPSTIQSRSGGSASPRREETEPRSAPAAPVRPFVLPAARPTPVQSSLLPLPPGTVAIVYNTAIADVPADLIKPGTGPAPPPAPSLQRPDNASNPAPKPVVPAGGRLEEAEIIDRTLPAYPPLALQRGVSGLVRLEASIDELGAVKNVRVVSGDPLLAGAAQIAVRKWKYKAAILNGRPIASTVVVQVVFGDKKK